MVVTEREIFYKRVSVAMDVPRPRCLRRVRLIGYVDNSSITNMFFVFNHVRSD